MTALTVFVALSPVPTMTDGIYCKSQAVMSLCTISPPSSYHVPTSTVNKMHSRRGHTNNFVLHKFFETDPPTPVRLSLHPSPPLFRLLLLFSHFISFSFLFHSFFCFVFLFLFLFHSLSPLGC